MPEQTEAQKKAHKNYIAKFARLEIRTTVEHREAIQAHASAHGESVNGFIGRAISETMERDGSQGTAGTPSGAGVVSLPSDVLKAAQTAAEAAGEAVGDFLARAVSEAAERDRLSRNS